MIYYIIIVNYNQSTGKLVNVGMFLINNIIKMQKCFFSLNLTNMSKNIFTNYVKDSKTNGSLR
jgi:hypothetical protein